MIADLDLEEHRAWLPQTDLAAGIVQLPAQPGCCSPTRLSTVSPRHAAGDPDCANTATASRTCCALALGSLIGILNGVDEEWNPATDPT